MTNDFSKPETRAIYAAEVRKRMEHPFYMSRMQAEMLVAAMMWEQSSPNDDEEE